MSSTLHLLNEKNKETEHHKTFSIEKEKNYTSEIDAPTTYAIYIQSIQKIIEFLNDAIYLTKQINDDSINEDKKIKAETSLFSKVEKIGLILDKFISLFSIVKNVDFKDTYHQLFTQFYSVDIQVKLLLGKHDIKYAKNSIKICKYLCKVFRMLEQHAKKENTSKI